MRDALVKQKKKLFIVDIESKWFKTSDPKTQKNISGYVFLMVYIAKNKHREYGYCGWFTCPALYGGCYLIPLSSMKEIVE